MRKKVENIHQMYQFLCQTGELACPHAMLENKWKWLLQVVEIHAWCKTAWNKGGAENE